MEEEAFPSCLLSDGEQCRGDHAPCNLRLLITVDNMIFRLDSLRS